MENLDPIAAMLGLTGIMIALTLLFVLWSNRTPVSSKLKAEPIRPSNANGRVYPLEFGSNSKTATTSGSITFTPANCFGDATWPLVLVEELDDPREEDGTPIMAGAIAAPLGGSSVPYACDEAKSLVERHDEALETIERLRLQLDEKDDLIKVMQSQLRDKRVESFKQRVADAKLRGGFFGTGIALTNGNFGFPTWSSKVFNNRKSDRPRWNGKDVG